MKRWLKTAALILVLLIGSGGLVIRICSAYVGALTRKKEVILQQNLWTMRRAIDSYWQDKEKPLQSFQELVDSGYLREIPADPLTGSNQTWVIEREKDSPNTPPGIIDVISAAAGADKNGKPYNQY